MESAIDAPSLRSFPSALRIVDGLVETILVVALIGEVAVVFANVIARVAFDDSFLWTEEVARLSLSVLAFLGGALAYRRNHHSAVSLLLNAFPPAARAVCLATADLIVLALSVCLFGLSLVLFEADWMRQTLILEVPFSVYVLPLVVSMPLFAIYAIDRLGKVERPVLGKAALGLLALVLLALVTRLQWLPGFNGDNAVYICLGVLFVLVFLGLPIAFALTVASASYFWLSASVPMLQVPQQMVANTGSFILLAIPFFIFAGLVMERGQLSLRLVEFGQTLIGHFRGGLHQVSVISMYLMSGLSGSDSADVAAVGTVLRNMPQNKQYTQEEGAAVLAASAVMGSTVPPSIGMLLLGSITQISIAGLFIGGIIPAAAIAACMMILIYVKARWAGLPPSPRAPLRQMLRAGRDAVLPLMMPVILFGGILTGVATPTEVSSFAVVYGIVVAMAIYKVLDFRGLIQAAIDSAILTGLILFILACASTLSWVLTVGYLPQMLAAFIQELGSGSSAIFLIGSICLLIVTGMLLEGLPALNILAPILVPMAAQFGLNELHYGMVLLIAMGVGIYLPPAGVGFYIACSVMGTSIEAAARAMIPYVAVLILGLLIVAFVPWITLCLPAAFGFQ